MVGVHFTDETIYVYVQLTIVFRIAARVWALLPPRHRIPPSILTFSF